MNISLDVQSIKFFYEWSLAVVLTLHAKGYPNSKSVARHILYLATKGLQRFAYTVVGKKSIDVRGLNLNKICQIIWRLCLVLVEEYCEIEVP